MRVDLCGGTLDCWPLFLLVPEARTINFGLNLGTRVRLEERQDSQIVLELTGLNYQKSFSNLTEVLSSSESELALVIPVLRHFRPALGFHLTLKSESPVGGGLGGSSSLLIGMIKAFCKWRGEMLPATEMVRLACNLETRVLKKPAGTQDYISALEGGLNVIRYGDQGPEWTSQKAEGLNNRFFLVDTGRPHHSGLNNWDVIKRALDGDKDVVTALEELALLSLDFESCLLEERWQDMAPLFEREFELRLKLSPYFSSAEIELLKKRVSTHKGASVKICGAGGGGCVMVWGEPSDLEELRATVKKERFMILDARFWAREPGIHGTD